MSKYYLFFLVSSCVCLCMYWHAFLHIYTSDCNNQFPPPSHTLLFSHSIPLSNSFQPTDNGNLCKHVNMWKCKTQTIHTYVRASNSTYTGILTFNNTQTLVDTQIIPTFQMKINHINRFLRSALCPTIANWMKPRFTDSTMWIIYIYTLSLILSTI